MLNYSPTSCSSLGYLKQIIMNYYIFDMKFSYWGNNEFCISWHPSHWSRNTGFHSVNWMKALWECFIHFSVTDYLSDHNNHLYLNHTFKVSKDFNEPYLTWSSQQSCDRGVISFSLLMGQQDIGLVQCDSCSKWHTLW